MVIQLTTLTQVEISEPKNSVYGSRANAFDPTSHYQCGVIGGNSEEDLEKGKDQADIDEYEHEEPHTPFSEPDRLVRNSEVPMDRDRIQIPHNPKTARTAMARTRKTLKANAASWAYARCSMLFFLALVITWVSHEAKPLYKRM